MSRPLVLEDLALSLCSPPRVPIPFQKVVAIRFEGVHDDAERDRILAANAYSLDDACSNGVDVVPVRLADERPPGAFAYSVTSNKGFVLVQLYGVSFS